jgi:hypothetical protein
MGGFRLRALVGTGAVEVVRVRTVKPVSEPDAQEEQMLAAEPLAGNGVLRPLRVQLWLAGGP